MAVERPEQNICRTKLSLFLRAYSKILVPFSFKLTYNCSKTTQRVTFMQKFKQVTNRDTGNNIQQMDDYVEKYLINNIHDSLEFKDPLLCQGLTGYYTSMGVTQYCHSVIISPVHVEGDLIVGTRLQFRMYGLSCLFSLKPRKICHP